MSKIYSSEVSVRKKDTVDYVSELKNRNVKISYGDGLFWIFVLLLWIVFVGGILVFIDKFIGNVF